MGWGYPTEFETITCIMLFFIFIAKQMDYAVFEVGLGKWKSDSYGNVIKPFLVNNINKLWPCKYFVRKYNRGNS